MAFIIMRYFASSVAFALVWTPAPGFQVDPTMKRHRLFQELRGHIGSNESADEANAASTELWPFSKWHPLGSMQFGASQQRDTEIDEDTLEDQSFVQRLENHGDVLYTTEVAVGGKTLHTVIDTGSFELLVFGTECKACAKKPWTLYNHTKSKTYSRGSFPSRHSFGSGLTYSKEAFDTLRLGPFAVQKQAFWEVYDANMDILQTGSFDAVLGVGPPGGPAKLAAKDAQRIHKELQMYEMEGRSPPDEMKESVKYQEEVEEHARSMVQPTEQLDVVDMSVCLGQESLSDGYFIWNDSATRREPHKFAKLAVVGDVYWSANLTDVTASALHAPRAVLGCGGTVCNAVLDTGTSLLMGPSSAVDHIQSIVDEWLDSGGNCDDLSKLPDLEFRLNGVKLSLPPEAYMGQINGTFDLMNDNIRKHMPNLVAKRMRSNEHIECEPLILSMDAETDLGPLWIFGMPFFRKYFTMFHFGRGVDGRGRLQAESMSVSVASPHCRPDHAPGQLSQLFSTKKRHKPARAHLRIDASKILLPTGLNRPYSNVRRGHSH